MAMEFWMAQVPPENRGKALILPVAPFGTITFFPEDPATLTLLTVEDQEHPIRVRGALKRMILALAGVKFKAPK